MENITSAKLIPFSLEFKEPLHTSSGILEEREGFVVNLKTENLSAFGEVSPLPGYSRERLGDVSNALGEILPHCLGSIAQLKALISELPSSLPSLNFGLESALLDLMARQAQLPLAEFLNPDALSSISVNRVYFKGMEIKPNASDVIKIKVSPENLSSVLEQLKSLPAEVRVRLDANRSFNSNNISSLIKELPAKRIEYVEEPIAEGSLKEIKRLSSVPIALDESLYLSGDALLHKIKVQNDFDVAILKPSMLGGPSYLKQAVTSCYNRNIKVVLSSSLEGPLGISTLHHLARAFLSSDVACGFDTLKFFKGEFHLDDKPVPGIGNFLEIPGALENQIAEFN